MTLLNSTKEGLKQVPSGSPGQIDFLAGQVTLKSYCKIRLFCLGKFCSSSVLEPAKLIGNVKIFLSVNNILFLFLYWAILNYSEKPGGYSGFQVTRMIEWRQKSKPKNKSLDLKLTPKKSHAEFPKLQNFQEAKQVWLYFIGWDMRRHYHKSSDCFEYPKNTCQIVPPKKILRSSLSLEIQSTPLETNERAQSCLSTCCSFLFCFVVFFPQTDDDPPHSFSQTFQLFQKDTSYFVLNDMFRLSLHHGWTSNAQKYGGHFVYEQERQMWLLF